ncbi:MAG: ATP phosphoribosyltransferase, partial [Bacteroidetes bacterium]|nr:ATP phosphoribosyltransferase [Bacteroidota bacterium]
KEMNYNSNKDLTGLNIATTYPVILQNYLDAEGLKASIHQISGSVEIAPGIGLSDAICDLVSSGSTLFSNGLKEVEVIMQSEALLVANKKLEPWQNEIVERLLFRLKSVKKSKHNKYILLNAPNDKLDKIIQILPGMKSPTIVPLAKEGWSSLHSVVNEDDFWELIENLKASGAQGILVVPIEKMIV